MIRVAAVVAGLIVGGSAWCVMGVRPRLLRRFGWVESVVLRVAFGFLTLTWWGIVLAQAGRFSLFALLAAPVLMLLLILAVPSLRRRGLALPRRGTPRRDLAALVVVVAIAVIAGRMFFPAFDVRLEARDPGVYYLTGVQLARTGSVDYVDPLIADMSERAREYFFPESPRESFNESMRYLGFYLETRDSARVVPQAMPVLPLWVAVGWISLGAAGGLAVGSVLALSACVALFVLGRRALGIWPAALAALFLAGSWVQSWFARYSAAEIPAQLLLFIGFYGLVLFRRHGDRGFGWMAAFGLGLSLFAKGEMFLLLGPLSVVLVVDAALGRLTRRQLLAFWAPLALLVVQLMLYARLELWPYYYDLLQQAEIRPPASFVFWVAGWLAGLVTLVWAARRPAVARLVAAARRAPRRFVLAARVAAATVLLLGVAWMTWWRPGTGSWDEHNMLVLTWAMSPVLVALAVLGLLLLLSPRSRSLRRGAGAFLFIAVAYGLVFIVRRQITPELPWAYRRWLPLSIPGLALVGAWAGCWIVTRIRRGLPRPVGTVAGAAVALVLLIAIAVNQLPLIRSYAEVDEMPGVDEVLDRVEGIFEPGALVIFEPRSRRGLNRFQAVLSIERGLTSLRLPGPRADVELLKSEIWKRQRLGKSTYLVTTGYLLPLLEPAAEPADAFRFRTRRRLEVNTTEIDAAALEPPTTDVELFFNARVYRLSPTGSLAPLNGSVDIGGWDDLYLNGPEYYDAELDGAGHSYRWTRAEASLVLPGLDEAATQIGVVADPDTPASLGAQRLTVTLDGQSLGTVELVEGWREYRFAIPLHWAPSPSSMSPPRLEMTIDPPINPYDDPAPPPGTDMRVRGMKLDRVFWIDAEASGSGE